MIRAEQPDKIICVGDLATLDSCSTHDTPGSGKDRKRPSLADDAEAVKEAQARMVAPLKKGSYTTLNAYLLEGNHEDRFARWADLNPLQSSAIEFRKLMGFDRYWGHIVDYKNWAVLDGVGYTHIPHNVMGRAVGGVNVARNVALNTSVSSVFGHSHSMQVATVPLMGDKNEARIAVSAPAFMEEGNVESYARGSQTGWIYGLLRVFPSAKKHRPFSFEHVTTERLLKLYG